MACRLIQPETSTCHECASTVMSPLGQAEELLRHRWDPVDRQPNEPARHATAKSDARAAGVLGSVGAAAGLGAIVAISWLRRFGTSIVRPSIDTAVQQLSATGFTVTHGMMSRERDVMIALDAKHRGALCEVGQRNVLLGTHIVE